MTALKATGLAKSYKSRQVVRDLSLELDSGEVVGLLGPNGAGKTTAFYMIVGLVPCDAGRIYLGETDITLLPMHRRAQLGLGYLPQEASVFRKLSVQDNVMAILETRDMERAAREQRLEQLLEELRIGHVRKTMG
jgi:lipopolysaccharide export system ATP-binding protein